MAQPTDGESAGLKAGAIGFIDALVIGLASTAPAYGYGYGYPAYGYGYAPIAKDD